MNLKSLHKEVKKSINLVLNLWKNAIFAGFFLKKWTFYARIKQETFHLAVYKFINELQKSYASNQLPFAPLPPFLKNKKILTKDYFTKDSFATSAPNFDIHATIILCVRSNENVKWNLYLFFVKKIFFCKKWHLQKILKYRVAP